jgi:hypothetical protein
MEPSPGTPLDTDDLADAFQRDLYRRMSGAERLSIAFRLSALARETAMAGIRGRHPGYSDAEVRMAWARLTLGDDIVRAVWPDRDLVDP